ncbi:hypothetical protein M569_16770, partial [Genlisea aurea]
REGKSRQFGFVGFRTEHEAEEAVKYFNKSFMDAFRITCEIALKIGDPTIPRPWSRHSLKKTEISPDEGNKKVDDRKASKAVSTERKQKTIEDCGNDDPQLQEFLEVMQQGSKSKLWANDAIAASTSSVDRHKKPSDDKFQPEKTIEDLFNDKDNDLDGGDEDRKDASTEGEIYNPRIPNDELVSDADYFKSRVKKSWSDSESSDDDGANTHSSRDSHKKISNGTVRNELEPDVLDGEVEYESSAKKNTNDLAEPSSSPEKKNDGILESGRLFIRNLPYTATEEEVELHFAKYGTVSQVHIVIDKSTRRSKGFGYVLFSLPESAARAVEEMDSSIFQGRLLHVMPAQQKIISADTQGYYLSLSSKSFKQQREADRKASEASGNTRSWNSLFMRPDTVVENISRKAGISKNELLDRESDDLAVRIALGETQVIAETKKALISAGVNISLLEEFAAGKTHGLKRSNHVILVKNLPYGSSESELSNMFGKFGSLDKIILPPTKTLALVIFLEPVEARAAFKALAYKRYKDGPLYLEWAPADILNHQPPVGDTKVVGEVGIKQALLEREFEDISDANVDLDRVESRSLYVKNLNFGTSEEALKSHFAEHMKEGKILSARVKKHLKNGKNVSMGFGFLEFDSVDTAVNVTKDMQGTVLDGHALILQQVHVKKDERPSSGKKGETDRSSTKLIVRNVAFEATDKDLRQLFAPFGQIKSLRLPMRFGKHRGFAFVEYATKQETKNALGALSNTHLYGRRLVI